MSNITIASSNGPLVFADGGVTLRGIHLDTIEIVPGPHNLEPVDLAAGYTDVISCEGAEAGLFGSTLVRAADVETVRRCIQHRAIATVEENIPGSYGGAAAVPMNDDDRGKADAMAERVCRFGPEDGKEVLLARRVLDLLEGSRSVERAPNRWTCGAASRNIR